MTKPLTEIGKYGGTWRRGFTGASDGENGNRMVAVDKWIFWDYTGTKVIPSLAKAWKISDDGKTTTIYPAQGHQVVRRQALLGRRLHVLVRGPLLEQGPGADARLLRMAPGGKPGKMVKKDDLTIEFQFDNPYWLFELVLAGDMLPGRGQAVGQFADLLLRRLCAQALSVPVPAQVQAAGRARRRRQGCQLHRLEGPLAGAEGLGAQPRPAGRAALESRGRRRHHQAAVGGRAQPLLLGS